MQINLKITFSHRKIRKSKVNFILSLAGLLSIRGGSVFHFVFLARHLIIREEVEFLACMYLPKPSVMG